MGAKKTSTKSGFNAYIGWAVTTLALLFLNKKSKRDKNPPDPSDLNVTSTKLGDVIPVVLGRCMVKSPLTSFWGDFSWRIYTEEYGAHSSLNIGSLLSSILLSLIPFIGRDDHVVGQTREESQTVEAGPYSGTTTSPDIIDEEKTTAVGSGMKRQRMILAVVNFVISLFTLLLSRHFLRTTIQKGFKYYLGWQQIICWAHPNARLKSVYMEEKCVWKGDEPASNHLNGSPFVIKVNDENLFGGPDENGGFVGELHVYFGGANQMGDPWMRQQMMASSVQASLRGYTPAYRPFISVVVPTAYIGKRATIPKMWFEIEIVPNTIVNEKATVDDWQSKTTYESGDYVSFPDCPPDCTAKALNKGTTGAQSPNHPTPWSVGDRIVDGGVTWEIIKRPFNQIGDDANPAEILYEMVVNNDWGLAEHQSTLNLESLGQIARTLYDEKAGLSILITSKTEARSLANDICSHVNAIRFSDLPTGLVTYKLIRDDYDENKLLEVNESNCSKISYTRQDWTNTVSEISVSFTDRSNLYETGTLSSDDPANIEIQNGVKTTKTYDYPYFTTSANALWAAKREGNAQGYPLATISLDVNRKFYTVRLGDVLRLNFPSYGIDSMLIRVNNINLSDFEDGVIHIDAMEDVFALGKTSYGFQSSTEWQQVTKYPTGVQDHLYFEAPYELLRSYDSYVYALACQPDPDTVIWTVHRQQAGQSFIPTTSMTGWTAAGRVVYDYPEFGPVEDMTGFEISNLYDLTDVKDRLTAGGFAATMTTARQGGHIIMVGDELMAYSSLTLLPNGNWQVGGVIRGIYDTVPHKHPSMEVVYFIETSHYANVTTGGPVCLAGSVVRENYNITTATATNVEAFNSLKVQQLVTVRRAERPTVQGRIRLSAHMISNAVHFNKMSGDLDITWVPRDKSITYGVASQDDVNDYWGNFPYVAPATEDFVVEVWVNGTRVRQEITTTNSQNLTWANRCLDAPDMAADTTVRIYCRDNGLDSYQYHERTFYWTIPTMVGVVATQNDADTLVASLDVGGQIVVQASSYNDPMYVNYPDSPIVLLGTTVPAGTPNAILNNDGTYWLPNGDAVVYSNATTGQLMSLAAGYTFKTEFYILNVMVKTRYYRWDGTKFNEVSLA